MTLNSIAAKLFLLAGVPLFGLLTMAALVISNGQEQLERSQALGSVESVAQYANHASAAVYALQAERAVLALELGQSSPEQGQLLQDEAERRQQLQLPLEETFARTQGAHAALARFASALEMQRLPKRLRQGLSSALASLDGLSQLRARASSERVPLDDLMQVYSSSNRELIRSMGALTELTDDGELLRAISSLVAVLELQERASLEHALLSNVFSAGDFPPGSYKQFVTTLTEEETFIEVFKNNATDAQFDDYQRRIRQASIGEASALRKQALKAVDGDFRVDAKHWFDTQSKKVAALGELADGLNQELQLRAASKQANTQQAFLASSSLSGLALVASAGMAMFIGRRVTQGVHILRDAANDVAKGKTDVRVHLQSRDELEMLGNAFNDMTGKLERAREALAEQARMSRDLEIAASIQSALLPPELDHPEFEFAGRMRPAEEVGGDFYDVLRDKNDSSLWVTIGDVSGHGVPAGLVMLMTQSAFGAFFRANPLARPDEVLRGVNDLLSEQVGTRLQDDKYVTGLLLTHCGDGQFVFAGAHEWPLIWRSSTGMTEVVEAPGPWLGVVRDLEDIPVSMLKLGKGDILCLYSDGLIEAQNASGELFDVAGLQAAFRRAAKRHQDLSHVADEVMQQVSEYASSREDDWTMLLIRRSE